VWLEPVPESPVPDMYGGQMETHLLAFARGVPVVHRGEDTDAAVEAGEEVGDGDAHLLRRAPRFAGERHHAAHRLDQRVVAGAGRVGAGLPEAGDRAVDQARVFPAQLLPPQPILGERADLEVLHQHVAALEQPQHQRLRLGLGDIQRERLLVAVYADEIGALLRVRHEGRREATGIVARFRPLDLDDLGAQVAQHLGAGGPGEDAGQVEDAQALQGAGRGGHQISPYVLGWKSSSGVRSRAASPSAWAKRIMAAISSRSRPKP